MSAFLETVVARARTLNRRVVFPEGDDERVRAAAERLARENVVTPILVSENDSKRLGLDANYFNRYSCIQTMRALVLG